MMSQVERRRFRRYPVYCPIQYKCENDKMRDESITLNVSEGGALISTQRLIDIATRMIVRVFFGKTEFAIPARVVHVHRNGCDRHVYDVGLEFIERPIRFIQKFYEEIDRIALCQTRLAAEAGSEITMAEASMKWYADSPHWRR